MAIREDLVTPAVNFLQDPNVASSPVENKISFLKSKNLTQEEIDTALARAGTPVSVVASAPVTSQAVSGPVQQQPYYGQYQTPPYGWQPPPPPPAKRDWRDWFIAATVMAGVGSGLYFITKRYIYPLVAPPIPEKLDQDKSSVDERFEKAFATLEQLAKDTDAIKSSEKERTELLDSTINDLEQAIKDTKSSSRRQENEISRLRDEMKSLKDILPEAQLAAKRSSEERLKEITNEVRSLKSLIELRMSTVAQSSSTASNHLKPTNGNAAPSSVASPAATPAVDAKETQGVKSATATQSPAGASKQDYLSSLGGRSSPFSGAGGKSASIPAWQLAMANRSSGESASGSQQDAGSTP